MEEMQKEDAERPPLEEAREKLEAARKEAEDTIAIMTNKAAAAYYKNDDSITVIEDGVELVSIKSGKTSTGNSMVPKSISIAQSAEVLTSRYKQIPMEEKSVASSVTIESLLSKQS